MKKMFTIFLFLICGILHAQEMEIKFDARAIENEFGRGDIVDATGTIRMTNSSVTWSTGHRDDIELVDIRVFDHPRYGEVSQYTWASKSSVISVYVTAFRPVELVRASHDVSLSGGLVKGLTKTYFFDLDSDSTFGSAN